jgi:hypothetical protein
MGMSTFMISWNPMVSLRPSLLKRSKLPKMSKLSLMKILNSTLNGYLVMKIYSCQEISVLELSQKMRMETGP